MKNKERKSKDITVKLGLSDKEKFVFYFRRPFISEVNEAFEKFKATEGLAGPEKDKKEFEITKENLINFATCPPEYYEIKENEADFTPVKVKGETVPDVFNELFGEYSPESEVLISETWLEFHQKRQIKIYSE